MASLSETDKSIIITIDNKPGYNNVYNQAYFSLLDLEIVNPKSEKTGGGGSIYLGGKTLIESAIDSTESVVDSSVKGFSKKTGELIDATEKSQQELVGYFQSNTTIQIEIKKKPKTKAITLTTELQTFSDSPKQITRFKSGLQYQDLENIVKDVCMQLSYFDFLNIEASGLQSRNIYKINDRYLFIADSEMEEKNSDNENTMLRDFQRLIIELMGEDYERGASLEKMKMLEKTGLFKYMNRLNDGVINIW